MAPILGVVWIAISIAQLDPNNPLSDVAAAFVILLQGGISLAVAFVLAGCALLLSRAKRPARGIYLALLGLACHAFGQQFSSSDIFRLLFLLAGGGCFYLAWRYLEIVWQRRVALAAALLSAWLVIDGALQLPVALMLFAVLATLLLVIIRAEHRLRQMRP